jgi:hypothetical protein
VLVWVFEKLNCSDQVAGVEVPFEKLITGTSG